SRRRSRIRTHRHRHRLCPPAPQTLLHPQRPRRRARHRHLAPPHRLPPPHALDRSLSMKWFLLFLPVAALAQQPQPPEDPISKYLIPPELVMTHAQEIALTDAQSASIKSEVRKTQTKFLDLQWDMQEE